MAVVTFMSGSFKAKGIMPYMNQKEFFNPNDLSTIAAFSPNSTILFQWLEDGSRPTYTIGNTPTLAYPKVFNIEACGKYGTDQRTSGGHWPWVHIVPAAPNSLPLNTIQNEWLFQNYGGVYTVAQTSDLQNLATTLPRDQFSTLNLPFLNGGVNGKWDWVPNIGATFNTFHSYAYVQATQKWWVYTRVNGAISSLGYRELWIPVSIKTNTNVQVTFTEKWVWGQGLEPGDTTVANIYTASTPMSDIQHPSHVGGQVFIENDVYSICFDGNSRHAYEEGGSVATRAYDAVFMILPPSSPIYSQYFDRTELNSRVAGEKAWYNDEFLTAGQIEAGTNITLKWRKIDGSLTGYTQDDAKAMNLVIEASGSGETSIQGRTYGPFHTNPAATIYYDETTATIRFQDEPLWYTDAMVNIPDTKLPIEFDVVGDPVINPSTSVIRARAINNNLHCSVTPLSGINYYPMEQANAPVLADYTVNHIRFVDTQSVTWDVKGDVMPTLMPDGSTAVRQGIIVKPVLNGLYVKWNIKSGLPERYAGLKQQFQYDIEPLNVSYEVDSLDTVEFFGRNGVVCTLEGILNNKMRMMIDRQLSIKHNVFEPNLPANTVEIRFESNLGNNASMITGRIDDAYSLGRWITWTNFGYNYTSGPTTGVAQSIPMLPVPFQVNSEVNSPSGSSGIRNVSAYYPRNSARWSSQWEKDYSAVTPENFRTLGTAPQQRSLVIGFWGWGQVDPQTNTLVSAPGSNHNIICGESRNFNLRTFGQRYAVWNGPYGAQGGNDEQPIGLDIGLQEGLYHFDATVQGIMGLTTTAPFNPVISQAVHLHLITGNYLSTTDAYGTLNGRVLQSLDVYQNYDFVPAANQSGYLQAVNSRPFSLQGSGVFWLRGGEQVFALLTYNPGIGEDRFFYQVCYVKMNCIKVANVGDMHVGFEAVDADADPTMYKYAPQRWHDMIFY